MMILPYGLGRLVTTLAKNEVVQVNIAGPLLALGYAWGHVTFSAKPVRDAIALLVFTAVVQVILSAPPGGEFYR